MGTTHRSMLDDGLADLIEGERERIKDLIVECKALKMKHLVEMLEERLKGLDKL